MLVRRRPPARGSAPARLPVPSATHSTATHVEVVAGGWSHRSPYRPPGAPRERRAARARPGGWDRTPTPSAPRRPPPGSCGRRRAPAAGGRRGTSSLREESGRPTTLTTGTSSSGQPRRAQASDATGRVRQHGHPAGAEQLGDGTADPEEHRVAAGEHDQAVAGVLLEQTGQRRQQRRGPRDEVGARRREQAELAPRADDHAGPSEDGAGGRARGPPSRRLRCRRRSPRWRRALGAAQGHGLPRGRSGVDDPGSLCRVAGPAVTGPRRSAGRAPGCRGAPRPRRRAARA